MKLPTTAIIPIEKLTHYLLVPREHDDKSKFLALADFTQDNPETLIVALRHLITIIEAQEDGLNDYGTFFRIDGDLIGPTNKSLTVRTIWLRRHTDNQFYFITLKPLR